MSVTFLSVVTEKGKSPTRIQLFVYFILPIFHKKSTITVTMYSEYLYEFVCLV